MRAFLVLLGAIGFFVIGALGLFVISGWLIVLRRSSRPDVSDRWRNEHAYDKEGDRR